jgi:large subunit ribosomal protein L13
MAGSVTAAKPKGFKTYVARPGEVKPSWHVVDATDKVLGRMAQRIAVRLMGKDKPTYTPHVDCGDFVIVINAEKVAVDPRKRTRKAYRRYSGYLGGLKQETFESVQAKSPERIIREAVRRMLPKSTLGAKMLKKLKVFKGDKHPHQAQKPKSWDPMTE